MPHIALGVGLNFFGIRAFFHSMRRLTSIHLKLSTLSSFLISQNTEEYFAAKLETGDMAQITASSVVLPAMTRSRAVLISVYSDAGNLRHSFQSAF